MLIKILKIPDLPCWRVSKTGSCMSLCFTLYFPCYLITTQIHLTWTLIISSKPHIKALRQYNILFLSLEIHRMMKEAAIPIFKSPKVQILDTTYLKKKKGKKDCKGSNQVHNEELHEFLISTTVLSSRVATSNLWIFKSKLIKNWLLVTPSHSSSSQKPPVVSSKQHRHRAPPSVYKVTGLLFKWA